MNQTREEFLRRHAEHAQRLDDLAGELQTLDLSEISHKVGDFTVNPITEILAVFQITHLHLPTQEVAITMATDGHPAFLPAFFAEILKVKVLVWSFWPVYNRQPA